MSGGEAFLQIGSDCRSGQVCIDIGIAFAPKATPDFVDRPGRAGQFKSSYYCVRRTHLISLKVSLPSQTFERDNAFRGRSAAGLTPSARGVCTLTLPLATSKLGRAAKPSNVPLLDFRRSGWLDYRRGMEQKRGKLKWQQLWHFSESCVSYPTRNFVTRKDVPPSSELCRHCEGLHARTT